MTTRCALAAVGYGVLNTQQLLKLSPGNERMREISAAVQEGARAYLNRQYASIALVGIFVAFVIAILPDLGPSVAIGFVIGGCLSAAAGYIGMNVSVRMNARVAEAARGGISPALDVAFRGGGVTGMLVVGLALLGVAGYYGILTWLFAQLHITPLLDAILALPVVGGNSLSFSFMGTFLVFLYIWLPYMILPIQAAVERVPANLIDASADLGAPPLRTFRHVILPLALPGIVAGSIFTFSLTLGDYIVPQIVGNGRLFIGQVVYTQQGTAGNIPLAAAFTVVPIVIMGLYLWGARKLGAFDAL